MVRYYQWKEDDDGYLTKLMVEADADEVLSLWKSMVETLKEHIHYKRRLFKETHLLKVGVTMEEILIHLGYSESYKLKHQSEIQRASACNFTKSNTPPWVFFHFF